MVQQKVKEVVVELIYEEGISLASGKYGEGEQGNIRSVPDNLALIVRRPSAAYIIARGFVPNGSL